jgi:nucleotide-binding universal stress UspA family protein
MDVPGRVLVAFDGSPLATDALAVFPAAEITVLNVVTPLDATMSEGGVLTDEEAVQGSEHERAEAIADTARERADERDATVTTTETGRPAGPIVAYVEDNDVEHVVMGSRGRDDLSRVILGSVASNVVEGSPVPVTVMR